MTDRLTATQYRTLSIIARYEGGQTRLMPCYWADRHHQAMIRRGLLRVLANPFTTRRAMISGWITARGRKAVIAAPESVRAQAKRDEERDYENYVRQCEEDGE